MLCANCKCKIQSGADSGGQQDQSTQPEDSAGKRKSAKEKMLEQHHEQLHKKLQEEKGQFKIPMKFMVDFLSHKSIDTNVILQPDNAPAVQSSVQFEQEPNLIKNSLMFQIRTAYLTSRLK